MQRMRQRIVIVLSVALVIGMIQYTPISAASNPYPAWNDSARTVRSCTSIAWQKAYDTLGIALPGNWGNAGSWYSNASAAGYSVGGEARVNSIAVWTGGTYGHVAYVLDVDAAANRFYIYEGGNKTTYGSPGVGSRWITNGNEGSGKRLAGFIYLTGESPSVQNSDTPYGYIDEITGGPNRVKVRGWCFDGSDLTRSLDIHVYIGGSSAAPENRREIKVVTANKSRPDVDSAYHVGEFHGFDITLETNIVGTKDVYIYAINIGAGENIELGHQTVTITKREIAAPGSKVIPDGDYRIITALDNNYALDDPGNSSESGTNLQIYANVKLNNQWFYVKYLNDGYYEITKNGLSLDVSGQGVDNGTNVLLYTPNGSNAQKWVIHDVGNGYYMIESKCNSKYLDVDCGKAENGTNVHIYAKNNTAAQKWKFVRVNADGSSEPLTTAAPTIAPTATQVPGAMQTSNASQTPDTTKAPTTTSTPSATKTPKPGATTKPTPAPVSFGDGISIQFAKNEYKIGIDETVYLDYTITPDDASTIDMSWSSSDEDIVSVDENGMVTSMSYGSAVITVTNTESGASCSVSIVVSPKKVQIKKLKGTKGGFRIDWKKCKEADGYQISYSTNNSFKNGKVRVLKKTTSYKASDLDHKKKYYVRVRSYVKVNGKTIYSDWSTIKIVKTK